MVENDYMAPSPPLLIRRAQLLGKGLYDLRIADGVITAITESLQPSAGERCIDAQGNLLLPGLHDHHLHLFATAAARESFECGPPAVFDEASLRKVLLTRYLQGEGWLRGVGFHERVCQQLDRHWLDQVCPDRPVRIQHRSGMLWVLNSCALQQLKLKENEPFPDGAELSSDGALNGRFYDLDAWLGERLERAWPSLQCLSAELARYGITGVTDTGVNNGLAVWEALSAAKASGDLKQRLLVMGNESLCAAAESVASAIAVGPLKLYLREAQLPPLEQLVKRMAAAHESGRAVAVHCVTRAELHFALAAFTEAGTIAGDRIEHASVTDDYAMQTIASLRITVVTQPHFIAERGDQYLQDVDKEDIPLLYRGDSFIAQGALLAAGSDAPYGGTDPWAAMRAAICRRTRDGVVMEAAERLTPLRALALYAGSLRQPAAGVLELNEGAQADLCLVDVPWEVLRDDVSAQHVALTICEGRIIYDAATDDAGDSACIK